MLDCPKESFDCQLIIPNNSIKICIDSRDAVEAHSCVDTNNEISLDEEYTTILNMQWHCCSSRRSFSTRAFGSKCAAIDYYQQLYIACQVNVCYQHSFMHT